jgi:hypothetical protein
MNESVISVKKIHKQLILASKILICKLILLKKLLSKGSERIHIINPVELHIDPIICEKV